MELPPEMRAAALEYQAADLHAQRAQAERVAELTAPTPPAAAPPLTPEEQAKAAEAAQLEAVVRDALPKVATVLGTVFDRAAVQFAGQELRTDDQEKRQLADATVPVINKYLPAALSKLVNTPEGVLLMTVGLVYGSKLVLPAGDPGSAGAHTPGEAGSTPAPATPTPPEASA